MVYTPHEPQKIAASYVGLVERQLVLPQLFVRRGIEDYKGQEGDAVTLKVPGRLPARRYAFRNNRAEPIKLDVYKERKVTTTFGDLVYSGSPIADEQRDFDGVNPTSLLPIQSRAVAEELNQMCVERVESAPFPVTIGGAVHNLKKATIEARKVMNKLRQPDNGRFALVGTDFEAALLEDEKMNLASNVGEGLARPAFETANLGTRYGITFVRCDEIDPESAYVMSANAFILLTGAPSVPDGVSAGSTASYNGLSLRWMKDYDFMYRFDRSTVDTYVGTQLVEDVFVKFDESTLTGDTTHKGEIVGTEDHFVRAIKLTLEGTSDGPTAGSTLAEDTGLVEADIWVGTPTP